MSRWNLSDLSKMPAAIQAQVYPDVQAAEVARNKSAQHDAMKEKPRSSPQSFNKLTPGVKEARSRGVISIDREIEGKIFPDRTPVHTPSALDLTPVYVPAALIRYILENWGSAFHVAGTETQRRKVVDNAVQSLAAREANPKSI